MASLYRSRGHHALNDCRGLGRPQMILQEWEEQAQQGALDIYHVSYWFQLIFMHEERGS